MFLLLFNIIIFSYIKKDIINIIFNIINNKLFKYIFIKRNIIFYIIFIN